MNVASPYSSPVKVIYRGLPCSSKSFHPFAVQKPVVPPAPCSSFKHYNYKVETVPEPMVEPLYIHNYHVQKPLSTSKCPLPTLTGLVARVDRMVLPPPGMYFTVPKRVRLLGVVIGTIEYFFLLTLILLIL